MKHEKIPFDAAIQRIPTKIWPACCPPPQMHWREKHDEIVTHYHSWCDAVRTNDTKQLMGLVDEYQAAIRMYLWEGSMYRFPPGGWRTVLVRDEIAMNRIRDDCDMYMTVISIGLTQNICALAMAPSCNAFLASRVGCLLNHVPVERHHRRK
jgi:hypothetical protein